ncbi:MAG: hypothetical protein IKO55_10115 [Kiritimatiellae bacterium]|nr:hypothetical protein [Kiritimatiellia bacterium]
MSRSSRLSVGTCKKPLSCFFVSGGSPVFVSLRVCGKPKAETTRRGTAKVVWLV